MGFPVAQMVKNLTAMQETWVLSPGREDPLEKRMATHSSILAWRIHGQRNLVSYSPWGHKESDKTAPNTPPPPLPSLYIYALKLYIYIIYII